MSPVTSGVSEADTSATPGGVAEYSEKYLLTKSSSTPPALQRFSFHLPWMPPWTLEFETFGFVRFVQKIEMIEW